MMKLSLLRHMQLQRVIAKMFCAVCLVLGLAWGIGCNVDQAYADACPAGGEHVYEGKLIYQAGEESEGLQEFTCLKCGDSFERVIPRTGHHWSEWVTEIEPTCMTPGYASRVCTNYPNNPHYEGREISALSATGEHSYVLVQEIPPTCETLGYRSYVCEVCGQAAYEEEVAPLGHLWGDWTVATPASATQEGREVRVCQHDGSHVEERTIAILADDTPDERPPAEPENHTSVQMSIEEEHEFDIAAAFKPNAVDAAFLVGDIVLIGIGLLLLIPLILQVIWIRKKRAESLDIYVERTKGEQKVKK